LLCPAEFQGTSGAHALQTSQLCTILQYIDRNFSIAKGHKFQIVLIGVVLVVKVLSVQFSRGQKSGSSMAIVQHALFFGILDSDIDADNQYCQHHYRD